MYELRMPQGPMLRRSRSGVGYGGHLDRFERSLRYDPYGLTASDVGKTATSLDESNRAIRLERLDLSNEQDPSDSPYVLAP